jgi:hypothetical protein
MVLQPSGATAPMYVSNGRLTDKRPWSFYGMISGLLSLIMLFFGTLFSGSTKQHTEEYKRAKQMPKWGKGRMDRPKGNIHSYGPAAMSGCAGGAGG